MRNSLILLAPILLVFALILIKPSLKDVATNEESEPNHFQSRQIINDTIQPLDNALANGDRTVKLAPTLDSADTEALLSAPDPNQDYPTIAHRLNEIKNRRGAEVMDANILNDVIHSPTAWLSIESLSDQFPLTLEERLDGREFIQLNPMKIESLVAGDEIEFSISQNNGHYTARIDHVQVGNDNTVSWVGHLENVPGLEGASQVYLTRGESLLVGGITTPNGHFEIEVRGNEGWIASSATLFKQVDELIHVDKESLQRTPAVSQDAIAQVNTPITPSSVLPNILQQQ